MNPYIPEARYLQALSSFQMGDHKVAEGAIRGYWSLTNSRAMPILHYMMGSILATRGEHAGAAKEFTRFLGSSDPKVKSQLVDAVQKQLAVWQQQGLVRP
jgi:TolA-binding protein